MIRHVLFTAPFTMVKSTLVLFTLVKSTRRAFHRCQIVSHVQIQVGPATGGDASPPPRWQWTESLATLAPTVFLDTLASCR